MISDRFPLASVGRFTWCVSIDTPIREHLRDLRFCVWTFFAIGKLYQVRFHVPSGRSANDQTQFRHTRQDYLTRHYLNLSTHERLPIPNDCPSVGFPRVSKAALGTP